MKKTWKLYGAVMAAVLFAALQSAGCTQKQNAGAETAYSETEDSSQTETAANQPNPMVPVADENAFEPLGVHMVLPAQAEDPAFFILNGEVAEIQFTADGVSYSFRAYNTAEDFAGIFERFTDHVLETSYESGDMSATAKIRTTESGGRLASWNWDETNYTLYTAAQISDEAITAFVQELLELTCSQ